MWVAPAADSLSRVDGRLHVVIGRKKPRTTHQDRNSALPHRSAHDVRAMRGSSRLSTTVPVVASAALLNNRGVVDFAEAVELVARHIEQSRQ